MSGVTRRPFRNLTVIAPHWRQLILVSALTLAGCHLSSPPPIDSAGFMHMWKTYEHCRMSADPGEILADVEKLKYISDAVRARQQASSVPAAAIRPLLSPLPSRLSVDPHALTRTCALHGSEVARTAGQSDVEMELLLAAAMVANKRQIVADDSVITSAPPRIAP